MNNGKGALDVLFKRCSTYEFSPKSISPADERKLLEAGRWAPSVLNLQPWDFLVVRDNEAIGSLVTSAVYRHFFSNPRLIIVIKLDQKYVHGKSVDVACGTVSSKDAFLSLGMPALQMTLAAEAMGIKSCMLTPDPSAARAVLGLGKDAVFPLMVGFGYPKKNGRPLKRSRRPLEEMVKRVG